MLGTFGPKGLKADGDCRWPEVIDRERDETGPQPLSDEPPARPKVDGRPPVVPGRGPALPRARTVTATATLPPEAPVARDAPATPAAVEPPREPRRSPFRHQGGAAPGPAAPSPAAVVTAVPAPPDPAPALVAPASTPAPVAEGPRGSARRLPAPPEPPFVACDGPYRWAVTLPSAIGRTTTIRVGSTGVELGGEAVAFDDIEAVRFKLDVEAALFRRAASARMSVVVTRFDGTHARTAARNALSTRRAEEIVSTLGYLWNVFGDTSGSRHRSRLVERIAEGAEVVIGGLRLTRIGVAWKKHPIEPWGHIGDPVVERRSVVISTSGVPIEISMAADDAYVLPALIPELRARFG